MAGFFHGEAHNQLRALPQGGFQAEVSSRIFGAFTHHVQADMSLHFGRGYIWIKSPPVIMDADARPTILQSECDSHATSIGMFADVGERFLQDA